MIGDLPQTLKYDSSHLGFRRKKKGPKVMFCDVTKEK